jgi:hypothetical protein
MNPMNMNMDMNPMNMNMDMNPMNMNMDMNPMNMNMDMNPMNMDMNMNPMNMDMNSMNPMNNKKLDINNINNNISKKNTDNTKVNNKKLDNIHNFWIEIIKKIKLKQKVKFDKKDNVINNNNMWLLDMKKRTIDNIIDYYNNNSNQYYYESLKEPKEIYQIPEEKTNLFSNNLYVTDVEKYTKVTFYIVETNENIDNHIIKYYPHVKESYIYTDYNVQQCEKINNILFILLSDSNYENCAKHIMRKLPLLLTNVLMQLKKSNFIHNDTIQMSTCTEYISENAKCLLTNMLVDNIFKTINSQSGLKCMQLESERATELTILNDNDVNDQLEYNSKMIRLKDLPDEYTYYQNNSFDNTKLLFSYIKLSKLRKLIDKTKERLLNMYVKNRLINNKLCISNPDEEILKLFKV